ncbi:MAG: preprotein translocase subunit SecG [Spirochaetota bacterium]
MGFLGILLLIVFVLAALLLIGLVLIQDEGGEGLGGIFGGGSAAPVGGRSGNILTRITSILGAVFLISSFGLAWINRTPESGNVEAAARRLQADGDAVEWWRVEDDPVPREDESEDVAEPDAAMEEGDDGPEE